MCVSIFVHLQLQASPIYHIKRHKTYSVLLVQFKTCLFQKILYKTPKSSKLAYRGMIIKRHIDITHTFMVYCLFHPPLREGFFLTLCYISLYIYELACTGAFINLPSPPRNIPWACCAWMPGVF